MGTNAMGVRESANSMHPSSMRARIARIRHALPAPSNSCIAKPQMLVSHSLAVTAALEAALIPFFFTLEKKKKQRRETKASLKALQTSLTDALYTEGSSEPFT